MAPRWVIEEQEKATQVAELDNIKRLRQNVDMAKAELSKALLRQQNRTMED